MKLLYVCLNCGKHFIGSDHKWDGRRCPECKGHLVPYEYGIDLSSEKDKTGFTPPRGYANLCAIRKGDRSRLPRKTFSQN